MRRKKTGREPPMVLFVIVIAAKALVHVQHKSNITLDYRLIAIGIDLYSFLQEQKNDCNSYPATLLTLDRVNHTWIFTPKKA
jgi:hypothetical protein